MLPGHRRTLSALKAAGALLVGFPAGAGAQVLVCGDGLPPRPSVGVDRYHCVGGACRVWGVTGQPTAEAILSDEGGRAFWGPRWEDVRTSFEFTVEPSLWDVDPMGPAWGRIQEGDVLVAVDGLPVTSARAGRILGDPTPGEPVELTVRHRGAFRTVQVDPAPTCAATTLSMGTDEQVGLRVATRGFDRESRERSGGSLLGLSLRCGECEQTALGDAGVRSWRFGEYPTVVVVRGDGPAGAAGILEGDRLTHVDGLHLLSVEGAIRLAGLESGDDVEVRVQREGRARTFTVRIPQ